MGDVLAALRARRWLVVLLLLAGLVVGGAIGATEVPTYRSSTELLVSASTAADAPSAYQGALFTQERVPTYAQVLGSTDLARGVVDELGLPLSPEQVAGKVVAVQVPKTDVLHVTVTDTSAQRAQAIVASLSRQFTRWVTRLETADGATTSNVRVTVAQAPTFDATPVGPQRVQDVVIGGLLGLLVGLVWALLRERTSRPLRTSEDVRAAVSEGTPVPVLPPLHENRQLGTPPVTAALDRSASSTRDLSAIRLVLDAPREGTGPRVVVVTSALPGEGKSTLAATLAVAVARSGRRAVLVDANFWRPRVLRYLGLDAVESGLAEVLTGSAELDSVVQCSTDGRLTAVPAGAMPADPTVLLGSPAMARVLDRLRRNSDLVIVDAPAVLSTADAAALAVLADGCLLVVRSRLTRRQELRSAVEGLAAVGGTVLGVVPTRVRGTRRRGRPSGYEADADRPRHAHRASAAGAEPIAPDVAAPLHAGRPVGPDPG